MDDLARLKRNRVQPASLRCIFDPRNVQLGHCSDEDGVDDQACYALEWYELSDIVAVISLTVACDWIC
jgi:cytochrome oxidase assembly protein ShyY1